ncbi:MAG: penicillin-binding protein 1A [Gammaproteobacteria bacterium]|nr:penicillin-binding protein 1A [Gammaproteobacteria bacterium]
MPKLLKFFKYLGYTFVASSITVAIIITAVYFYVNPDLPSVDNEQTYQLDAPLRVYSKEQKLIAEFGVLKREPIIFKNIPVQMTQAIIAAEDNRFYEHPGVDYRGLLRAGLHLIRTGTKGQGGSTITMQVARNFFLSRKKTYLRKIREIFLAFKLEQHFSKEKILELYLNKIYLGHRSYGVATASKIYYGKKISELSLPQFAMLAGLPKAPSTYNPVTNKKRATQRRNYVLKQMHEINFITTEEYSNAVLFEDNAILHRPKIQLAAPYIAEMARAWLSEARESDKIKSTDEQILEEDIYTGGYKIYTTIRADLQKNATSSLQKTLLEYERRHGYRGVISHIDVNNSQYENLSDINQKTKDQWLELLTEVNTPGNLISALVINTDNNTNQAKLFTVDKKSYGGVSDGKTIDLTWENIKWARKYISETRQARALKSIDEVLTPGDVIYIEEFMSEIKEKNVISKDSQLPFKEYRLAQIPAVEGAIVSIKPRTGEILALSGGFDFYHSKYNRVTQANRQPGSNIKPFIYSAALSKGYTVASTINDAPIVFKDKQLEGTWRPANYSGKFFGPTRMRKALYKSRNIVSIRLLMDIGINYALNHLQNYGFDPDVLPHNLSLALGSASLTPMDVAQAYAIIANGGYQITPWFIDKIVNKNEEVVYQYQPKISCSKYYDQSLCPEEADLHAKQTIPDDIIFLLTSMLKDVITRGTGRKARVLERNDLAGKTGTTNEQVDAWFSGFNSEITTTTWVGFDQPKSMGRYETGGKAALPMWIKYMKNALVDIEEKSHPIPENIVTVKIDKKTGKLANSNSNETMFEYFIKGTEPEPEIIDNSSTETQQTIENLNEELF